jgi:hypothetical protein
MAPSVSRQISSAVGRGIRRILELHGHEMTRRVGSGDFAGFPDRAVHPVAPRRQDEFGSVAAVTSILNQLRVNVAKASSRLLLLTNLMSWRASRQTSTAPKV